MTATTSSFAGEGGKMHGAVGGVGKGRRDYELILEDTCLRK